METAVESLVDGFDPLGDDAPQSSSLSIVFDDARKRIIQNILKSYTGMFDLFSELLQNALDAVQQRQRVEGNAYKPHIWVSIDIPDRIVRVTDNGIGMDVEQFKYCLRPNVSFKKNVDLRGHKGVGATFVAYGFSFLKIQTKKNGQAIAAILRSGRQWAEDESGTVPRPKLESAPFEASDLSLEPSGTSVQIVIGKASGERPRDLGWIGARTADQWYDVLRIKTPLGGVYLSSAAFYPTVTISVRSPEKVTSNVTRERADYYYPHEIPNIKAQSLRDIKKETDAIQGDADTKMMKLPSEFKRLQCAYEIWSSDEILREGSDFDTALSEEEKELVERHQVFVYGCFLHSAKMWAEFNEEILGLRKGQKVIHGGLQMASDFMAQGDLSVIPLTSAIGYQANSHVIVHFMDGNPDMGRKVFQPELTSLADHLSVRAVTIFRRFLRYLRPDTGSQTITIDKKIYDWKQSQVDHRAKEPLTFSCSGQTLSVISKPRQEQDVIALFHELIGMRVLRGFRFYGTSQSDLYDSVFFLEYAEDDNVSFDIKANKLGVNREFVPGWTEPKILEYKFEFESLVSDFEKDEKFAKHVDLAVCWTVGGTYKERFYLQPLLVGDEGSARTVFGSTHRVFSHGSNQPEFELIVLEDLLAWLQAPAEEEIRQKHQYVDV
jgi:Histidine kinase-, DNA gyrase B-, and HSP90-like ATPase